MSSSRARSGIRPFDLVVFGAAFCHNMVTCFGQFPIDTMRTPAHSNLPSVPDSTPRARIDSQDLQMSQPLRDFLSSWGCAVFINQPPVQSAVYHLVCGERDFVQSILPSEANDQARTVAIIWDYSSVKNPIPALVHVRQVLVDPHVPTSDEITKIFQFFFTSRDSLLDLRRSSSGLMVKALEEEESVEADEKERIAGLISDIFQTDQADHKPGPAHRRRRPGWGSAFFILLLIPVLGYVLMVVFSIGALALAGLFLKSGDISGAARASGAAQIAGVGARGALAIIGAPLTLVGLTRPVRTQEQFVSLVTSSGQSLGRVGQLLLSGQELGKQLLAADGQSQPAVELEDLRAGLAQTHIDLGLAQATVGTLRTTAEFGFATSVGDILEQTIDRYRLLLEHFDRVLTFYKDAGGFDMPRTYLVLFQNSMELRPTGGFIGSIGKLTLEGGKVSEFTISDVYELDGQLKGHVDPPGPIRELLLQEHWYLRDSNWDPNFSGSGARAAWFYEKESGQSVDGVIAVSTPFVVDLLKATGPITLADYNDQVTSDNFFGKSLFYVQTDSFPGSTKKKDFLGSLARALMDRLTSMKGVNTTLTFRAIIDSLARHDILFSFKNPQLELLVNTAGWGGRIPWQSGCDMYKAKDQCTALPLAVVDANLGVNKVNYFIENSLRRDITIADTGRFTETLVLSSHNSATDTTTGGAGTYKSYTRFYLPDAARLDRVLLGGLALPRRDSNAAQIPDLPYAQVSSDAGRTVVAVAATLPAGADRRITIAYSLLPASSQVVLMLLVATAKQPGVGPMPLAVTVHYPDEWGGVVNTSLGQDVFTGEAEKPPRSVATDGSLEYNTTLSSDQMINLTFDRH